MLKKLNYILICSLGTLLQDMLNQKITPNIYVLNSLMNVNARDLNYAFHVYKNMQVMIFSHSLSSLLGSCIEALCKTIMQNCTKGIF